MSFCCNVLILIKIILFYSGRVTEDTSLFHYGSFESYSTFNDLRFRPVFPRADALESTEALKVCGHNRQCLFDFLASDGDVTLAQQTMQSGQIFQTIIQNTQPGIEKNMHCCKTFLTGHALT